MTDHDVRPNVTALRKLEAALHFSPGAHPAIQGGAAGSDAQWSWHTALWAGVSAFGVTCAWLARHRFVRRSLLATVGLLCILAIAFGALWLRLMSGPVSLDLATPWLTAAIQENFGRQHKVEIGGTQIERDVNGHTAIRIRDIVVRDPDGTIVASAPKAEVGVSGSSLLAGRLRAERLSLVGAELSVRIEKNGEVTVFAGANKRPIATAAPSPAERAQREKRSAAATVPIQAAENAARSGMAQFDALMDWIDGLSKTGLDGHDLGQLGLKNGNLIVEDQRDGKRWSFENINLALARPAQGGVVFTVNSDDRERPWVLTAAMTPRPDGKREVKLEARKVAAKDLLLALRLGDGSLRADVPLSASIRGEIGPDGIPVALAGRIVAETGTIGDARHPDIKLPIERAEVNFEWDGARQALTVPFQILSGDDRFTLLVRAEAPRGPNAPWQIALGGGTIVLGTPRPDGPQPIIINRIGVRARFDPVRQRLDIEHGDLGNLDLGVAFSGNVDFSSDDPRVALGIAGTRMTVEAFKRLWPVFVVGPVRAWALEHVDSGAIERAVVAINAPMSTLREGGPRIAPEGLSIDVVATGVTVQPVPALPAIRDADLNLRVVGQSTSIALSRGTVELPSGRKLAISNGLFEVPDTHPPKPASRTQFRLDGPVPAAAELLALDRLRAASGAPFDPATTRGTMTAQVGLALPIDPDLPEGSSVYDVKVEISNFAADKMIMGQKVEAATLRVAANNQGYDIKGDVRIGGAPASLDYRKASADKDAEVRIEATLDQAARARLGIDFGSSVTGSVPIKVNGRVTVGENNSRLAVDADFTNAAIDELLPGWIKPAGRAARARFTLMAKPQGTRFDDLSIDGTGVSVRGHVELDDDGDLVAANFPVFGLSDGDKASLKVERAADGSLRAIMRGDVYDGRNIIKAALSGAKPHARADAKGKRETPDVDLDVKLGAVAGFHGEALRALELKMSRRGGKIRSFSMNGKLGVDAPLIGDLRGRSGGRQVIYVESSDAGAFLRFTDVYPRMIGGQVWIAMDPPSPDHSTQEGLLNIRDFAIRGEAALDRVVSTAPGGASQGVEFTRMRVEFTRNPGRFTIRDGVVRGPIIGATIEGDIDYLKNDVHMRGTFVPLYGINNVFGQLPIVGLFLGGGSNEGLVGITYEVVGQPGAPVLRVNPISAVAPGLLRKFFEFPGARTNGANSYADQPR